MESLKANELRIGNLVGLNESEWNGFNQFFEFMENSEVKSFLDDNNKFAIVKTIAEEVELIAYDVDLDFYSYKEIQPIKLTEDWLIRFGFIRHNLKDVFYSKSYGTNGVAIVKFEPVYDRFCYQLGTGHNKVLDYVHQLMNLHYAITGSELTFKN